MVNIPKFLLRINSAGKHKISNIYFICFSMCISLFLFSGSIIQPFFEAILAGDTSVIYKSISECGCIVYSGYKFSLDTISAFIGLITLLFSCLIIKLWYMKSWNYFNLILPILTFLCLFDIFNLYFSSNLQSLQNNILFNLFGALFYSAVIVILSKLFEYLTEYWGGVTIALSPVFISIVFLFFTIILHDFLFKNTLSDVFIKSSPPFSFTYYYDAKKELIPFGITNIKDAKTNNIRLEGVDKGSIVWEANGNNSYSLEIRAFDGSFKTEIFDNAPQYTYSNLSGANVTFEVGAFLLGFSEDKSDFIVMDNSNDKKYPDKFSTQVKKNRGSIFTMVDKGGDYSIRNSFASDNKRVEIFPKSDEFTYYVLMNLPFEEGKEKARSRKVVVETDLGIKSINFHYSSEFNSPPVSNLSVSRNELDYYTASKTSGFAITLKKNSSEDKVQVNNNRIQIKGWQSIIAQGDQLAGLINKGLVDVADIYSEHMDLHIDDNKYAGTTIMSGVQISGDNLSAMITMEGDFILKGDSSNIVADNKRVSRSKWEKLSKEFKVVLFTLLLGFLGGLGRIFWSYFRNKVNVNNILK